MFILILSPSSVATLHTVMVYILVTFFLQLQGTSAYISAHNQDFTSEIADLKALYLQQQSLLEAMTLKIQDQEMEIASTYKKIEEQGQKLRMTESVNRAQTKTMDNIQRVFKREDRRTTLTTGEEGPAFHASISSGISSLGTYQTIVFDHVSTNEMHMYENVTGIFRPPSSGIYVFRWTTMNQPHSKMTSELLVNGVVKGKSLSDATNLAAYVSASNTVVLRVYLGDLVWIRSSISATHSGDVYGDDFSTFSGWKLF